MPLMRDGEYRVCDGDSVSSVCDSHSLCHLMNDDESVSSAGDGEFPCHLVSDGESVSCE